MYTVLIIIIIQQMTKSISHECSVRDEETEVVMKECCAKEDCDERVLC